MEQRNEGLADFQLLNGPLGVDGGIRAERLRRGADRLLLFGREGTERMLDAIAKLGRDAIRHVGRALRHVVNADALRADEAGNALDLLEDGLRRFVEEQVRLVEQEHELRLIEIADLGSLSNNSVSSQSRNVE